MLMINANASSDHPHALESILNICDNHISLVEICSYLPEDSSKIYEPSSDNQKLVCQFQLTAM